MSTTETPTPRSPCLSGWLRGLLFVSLAFNLVIVGVVAGAVWRHAGGDGDRRAARADRVSIAYIRALDRADRRAIRDEMRARLPGRDALRAQIRDSFGAVLATLRAPDFDRAALAAQLEAQFSIGADQQRLARELMIDRLAGMSLEQRRAFADRVEDELARMARRDRDR